MMNTLDHITGRALAAMGLADAPRFSVPMPLNTLLWRVVAMTQRMSQQRQRDRPPPAPRLGRHAFPARTAPGPDRPGDEGQHEQRMAGAAMPGHARYRIVREQRDRDRIEIGQRAERRAREQRGAAMAGGRDGGGDGAAEDDLGERIHGAMLTRRHGGGLPRFPPLRADTPNAKRARAHPEGAGAFTLRG
jgi:hypothetical protein